MKSLLKNTSLQIFGILFIIFSFAQTSFSDDHALTEIKGTNIDLKLYDHTIAGSIKDFVVFGYKEEGAFASRLILKKDGQIIEAQFAIKEGKAQGEITHTTEDGFIHNTHLELVKFLPQESAMQFKMNGELVRVDVKADVFENDHFQNPEYTLIVNGEKIQFKIINGEACYGFSTHLIFLIVGAYIH